MRSVAPVEPMDEMTEVFITIACIAPQEGEAGLLPFQDNAKTTSIHHLTMPLFHSDLLKSPAKN